MPTMTVWCFSNTKPWVTPEKAYLMETRRFLDLGTRRHRVQNELKDIYRRKLDNQLHKKKHQRGLEWVRCQWECDWGWANELKSVSQMI